MKVLFINPILPEYRYPIFQQIAEHCELTVLHSGRKISKGDINFEQIIIPLKQIGPFTILKISLNKLCKKFDIVVSEANIRHIDRNILVLNHFRKYKWIAWGIGVSASYNKVFDADSSLDKFRHFIFRRADANIFYSDYPVKKYIQAGFKRDALFVANNTTFVAYDNSKSFKKENLLFVGTLYKQKKIYDLLYSYKEALAICDILPSLFIIGDGIEYNPILEWIKVNRLDSRIKLLGAIYDHSILEQHFRSALACISPGQAGLSVLTSMGYGTPYITMKNAITGGEIFNISNDKNGVLYNNKQELTGIIIDIGSNPEKYINMGLHAREFYIKNRQVENMVKGFLDAFKYVMDK